MPVTPAEPQFGSPVVSDAVGDIQLSGPVMRICSHPIELLTETRWPLDIQCHVEFGTTCGPCQADVCRPCPGHRPRALRPSEQVRSHRVSYIELAGPRWIVRFSL